MKNEPFDTEVAGKTGAEGSAAGVECQCRLCERHRRVEEISARGDLAEMRCLIRYLENHAAECDADNDYYRAIHDGSWPTAREQALKIIARCDANAIKLTALSDQHGSKGAGSAKG